MSNRELKLPRDRSNGMKRKVFLALCAILILVVAYLSLLGRQTTGIVQKWTAIPGFENCNPSLVSKDPLTFNRLADQRSIRWFVRGTASKNAVIQFVKMNKLTYIEPGDKQFVPTLRRAANDFNLDSHTAIPAFESSDPAIFGTICGNCRLTMQFRLSDGLFVALVEKDRSR